MINLRNNISLLYDFYLVAKSQSISKASQDNMISQPNLSRNIRSLEENLQLKLINSNNKGISLTSDGEKLFKKLDEMFSKFNNYEQESTDKLSGTITIGTTRNIADNKLIDYIIKFNKLYPNVKIKIITDSASNLNDYLINHKIDLLIDYLPNINSSEKYDFTIKTIGSFKTYFATSRKFYEKYSDKIKTLKDLERFNLAIPGSSRRRQILDELLQKSNVSLEPKLEMPDSKLMADFVKKSDYIGYFIEEEIETNDLVKIDLIEPMPENIIGLIYSKNTINKISKKFIELVLEKN